MTRSPSPPPELPGFTYVQPLGTGGFADVFLYEQQLPRRRVAVKVLLAERITSGAAQEFTEEANVMALLSTHPAIVTIYQAGVAGDGRPYLVMEYCPRPNLQARSRRELFSVAEALRVGVQVAGAVETAHRAGVLHRDIKPANILVTEYNRPALTDFGIASTAGAVTEAAGMSIPWSPPESFADPPRSGLSTDIYALGATVYTLLSGRSPFERVGERNSSADLIERIERMALQPLDRADSPASLQAVLERAMAKNPDDRYPSAVAFARALQKVQIELAHSVTPIDIIDEHPAPDEVDDDGDGLTRVREVVSIDPDAAQSVTRPSAATEPKNRPVPQGMPRFDAAPPAAAPEHTVPRMPAATAQQDDKTIVRAPRVLVPDAPATPPPAAMPEPAPDAVGETPRAKRRSGLWIAVSAVVVVLVIGGIVLANMLGGATEPEAEPTPQETSEPVDITGDLVPKVTGLAGVRNGDQVTFTWTNPDPKEGDLYLWQIADPEATEPPKTTDQETAIVTSPERACIEVTLRRSDGRTAGEPQTGCVP
ncbi:serine/threonine-protein kinase [Microbacterium sp. YJN-G]|uniref:serine/threonine-protein kinase n=1 Tax=Microbacterium sp. YJN-G TaxID=2763257 RepID=UPI0018776545|nr:serine/threonine-protein kinase [Microbacterium sp. YJN-G]